MVSRRLRGAAAAVVCALALSSCGTVHPGAAAQVGDASISDDQLQRGTHGFCELIDLINAAQQGANPPVPVRSALLSALNTLVTGEALDQLAAQQRVDVTDAAIRQWISGLPIDISQAPAERTDEVQTITERVARNSLLVDELGAAVFAEQSPGGQEPPPNQARELGQQLLNDYLQRIDVETDPRYGQVLDTQQLPGSGSLSIAVSDQGVAGENIPEASNTLPDIAECS